MKRIFIIFALLIGACTPVFAEVRFSLKATAGYGYIAAGDFNKTALSYREKYGAFPEYTPAPFTGFHSAPLLGFEACFAVSKRTFIGLGISYYPGSFGDSLSYDDDKTDVARWYTISLKVIPVTVSLNTAFPVRPWLDMVLTAGAGYYLTIFEHTDCADFFLGYTNFVTANPSTNPLGLTNSYDRFKSKRGAFGVHGGLGLEVKITPGWRFLVQTLGRWAEIKDIAGVWSSRLQSSHETVLLNETDNTAYYIVEEFEGKPYSRLYYGKTAPAEARQARKATINLSGFVLQAGFRFTFGKTDPNDGSLIFTY